MSILEAHDLYRFYHVEEEETLALQGVNLRVEAGEIVSVQGPSGSGKSTLLACLAGLDVPDGGYVIVSGIRITRKSEAERAAIRARDIGIMMQSGNLFGHLTVEENIALQLHLSGNRERKTRIDELAEQLGLEGVRRARPVHISGGEAARAALAVALAAEPKVLLADEPTGEVDAETERRVMDAVDDYRRQGSAVLIVTHSAAVAQRSDRTIHLVDGRVVA